MKIVFHDSSRPLAAAKAVKSALKSDGIDIALSPVREATAKVFGYRGWNDLLTNGLGADRTEINDAEAVSWLSSAAAILSLEISVTFTQARRAVDVLAPFVARRAEWRWEAVAKNVARSILASAKGIEPFRAEKGLDGALIHGDRFDTLLLVSADGSQAVYKDHHRPDHDIDYREDANSGFGEFLQRHGLWKASPALLDAPDELMTTVLSRLDPVAMHRLRLVPCFSPSAYTIARTLPEDAPFAHLIKRMPMLASQIQHSARATPHGADVGVLGSPNPLETFVEKVAACSFGHGLEAEQVRTFLEAVATRSIMVSQRDISIGVAAILSHCPPDLYPKTSQELAAAFRFADRADTYFSSLPLSPAAIYSEFRERFNGDWDRLASQVDATRSLGLGTTIAGVVVAALAVENGHTHDLDRCAESDLAIAIDDLLYGRIGQQFGAIGLDETVARWYETRGEAEDHTAECVKEEFAQLSTLRLLPKDLANLPVAELVARLGVDVSAFKDPYSPSRLYIFHESKIGGLTWRGIMSADGPYITCHGESDLWDRRGGVALGSCTFLSFHGNDPQICKYDYDQVCVSLTGFDQATAQEVSDEFGLGEEFGRDGVVRFWDSPSALSLGRWIKEHPEYAGAYADRNSYLPGWHDRALAMASAPRM